MTQTECVALCWFNHIKVEMVVAELESVSCCKGAFISDVPALFVGRKVHVQDVVLAPQHTSDGFLPVCMHRYLYKTFVFVCTATSTKQRVPRRFLSHVTPPLPCACSLEWMIDQIPDVCGGHCWPLSVKTAARMHTHHCTSHSDMSAQLVVLTSWRNHWLCQPVKVSVIDYTGNLHALLVLWFR